MKSISTADDDLDLPKEEKALLDAGEGRVLLFQLNGAMIFGVAKAIGREHNAVGQCDAVVFDLGAVSHLGVTAALALENALKLFEVLPADHTRLTRAQALAAAVEAISG